MRLEKVETDADKKSYWLDGVERDCEPLEFHLVAHYSSGQRYFFVYQLDPIFGGATFQFVHSPIELPLKAEQIACERDEMKQGDLVDSHRHRLRE